MKYTRKPIEVDAVQYKGNGNFDNPSLPGWIWQMFQDKILIATNGVDPLIFKAPETNITVEVNDFIVHLSDSVFVCKPEIFEKTYEPTKSYQSTEPKGLQEIADELERINPFNNPNYNRMYNDGYKNSVSKLRELLNQK